MLQTLPTSLDALDFHDWEALRPYYEELQRRALDAEAQRGWLEDWSNLTKFVREAYGYTYVQSSRFTNMSALLYMTSLLTFLIGIVSEQITSLMFARRERQ